MKAQPVAKNTSTKGHSSNSFFSSGNGGSFFPSLSKVNGIEGSLIQRQCEGNIPQPPNGYASNAAGNLRCDENNTGHADITVRINNGLNSARGMVHTTTNLLTQMLAGNAPQEVVNHFKTAFGLSNDPTPGQIRRALGVYRRMCAWLMSSSVASGQGMLCLPGSSFRCTRIGGSAVCDDRRPINLCSNSIMRHGPTTAELIIHELAHRFGICTPDNVNETYEGDRNFPTNNAINTSADSYSMFAREANRFSIRQAIENDSRGQERPPFIPDNIGPLDDPNF